MSKAPSGQVCGPKISLLISFTYTIKSSQAISRANAKLKINVSETSSVSIIRVTDTIL
jgi:hypothetical protein